jgi:hypothetical protein
MAEILLFSLITEECDVMKRFLVLGSLILFCQIVILGQQRTEVPMRFRGSMPVVDVYVNGEGPFLFAIDTGGQGQARADTTLVEKLKLKKIGQVQASDGSGNNSLTLDLVGMDTLRIGDMEFKKLEALTRNYNRSPRLSKIDGILGLNLFADHLLTLDYPNKKVIIEKSELPAANGQNILNFGNADGIASIELNIGGEKLNAHIDSGNMVGASVLPSKLVEKQEIIGQPQVVGQARTVSNTFEIKQAKLKGSIRFGQFEFKQPLVTYPSPRSANIGSQLLKEFAITFDQKNKRLKLKRTIAEQPQTVEVSGKLKEYVGQYESRTISAEDGSLYIQRHGGPKLKLKEEEKDKYSLERIPRAKIQFIRDKDGKITEIKVLNQFGEWETSKRVD